MVERTQPQDERWAAVDRYIGDHLLGEDVALAKALAANAAGGLPDIDVSPAQGRMLHLLARMAGARRILEIGTLGGYSTIELARALPGDGRLVTLEIDPHRADIARANIAAAGLADRCEVITGPALDSLATLKGPFAFVFIDADKESNAAYVEHAIRLSRPGTAIVVDNVIREGNVLDADSPDVRIQGTRRLFEAVAANPRLTATAVQTVGAKKWDGFLLALVTG
ncbi:O-methyltransferase [Sphingomonas sp.]|jgi:predicted O-methyltransferase YrrM|uniref:O-methyltransferase n=1 Tax=Sphingomonas sp. TaxID=28214 RepID=UPI002E2FB61B|nr:O-methyltransferase [Sphingomonas sp.]HEX4694061.1 O-methyltransferase [Sphingomonas sp.]